MGYMTTTNINAAFEWKCQPEAENLVLKVLDHCISSNPMIAHLEQELLKHTSTRLFDWLDHVAVPYSDNLEEQLERAGFVNESTFASYRVYRHPGAQLPSVILSENPGAVTGIAVSVESIAQIC